MKPFIATSAIALFFVSCTTSLKVAPHKGQYLDKPYQITSQNNFAKTWDKIIDFFAQQGLSIKIIDRSSGLIVSDKSALTWSREKLDGSGVLVKPDAWVVIDRIYNPLYKQNIDPAIITGEWNIRIKPETDSTTLINVNLVNIVMKAYVYGGGLYADQTMKEFEANAKSTGNFEKLIADIIK